MASHKVVSRDEWIEARKQFLVKEKEFKRLRDQLSQQRRELPCEAVDRAYVACKRSLTPIRVLAADRHRRRGVG